MPLELANGFSTRWKMGGVLIAGVLMPGAAFACACGCRPGLEVNAAAGINYRGWNCGRAKIAPIAQIIGSVRGRDNGTAAAPDDSGYQRILLAPGLEVNLHPFKFYADVEIPVYQNMKGNQLVAPALFKVNLSNIF